MASRSQKSENRKSPERPEATLSIGELARSTGVSPRTVRYYEELGILPSPPRSEGGTRRYPSDYKFYIEGALLLKDAGFTLDELKVVGRLALGAKVSAAQRARAVSAINEKIETLEHRMRVLGRVHDLLKQQAKNGAGSPSELAEFLGGSEPGKARSG